MPGWGGLRRFERQWIAGLAFGLLAAVCGLFFIFGFWRILWLAAIPPVGYGILLFLLGVFWSVLATRRFYWQLMTWSPMDGQESAARKALLRGPKIVVVGGGSGLGTILRGLKKITANLTAIVTVADDGGSSGRIRKEFGMLPPGDIRNCLIAMADIEPLMERLMQYRFNGGTGLAGHSFGNLFLTAMTGITGDFEQAIRASSQVLAVRGHVYPSTLENIILKAELVDGSIVKGESAIGKSTVPIKQLSMEPDHAGPVPEALTALKEADIIILGPGSLYTSVIPNLLVKETAEAIRRSSALKVYICNAMTQSGETVGYSAADHVRSIIEHAGSGLIDYALINTKTIPPDLTERYREEGAAPVEADMQQVRVLGVIPMGSPLILTKDIVRHDADQLAAIVLGLLRTDEGQGRIRARVARRVSRIMRVLTGSFHIHR